MNWYTSGLSAQLKKRRERRSTSFGTKLGTELALKLFEFWGFHLPIGLTGLGSGTREKKKKKGLLGPPGSHMVVKIDLSQGLLFIICPVTIVLAIYPRIGLITWLCGSTFADKNEIWLFLFNFKSKPVEKLKESTPD